MSWSRNLYRSMGALVPTSHKMIEGGPGEDWLAEFCSDVHRLAARPQVLPQSICTKRTSVGNMKQHKIMSEHTGILVPIRIYELRIPSTCLQAQKRQPPSQMKRRERRYIPRIDRSQPEVDMRRERPPMGVIWVCLSVSVPQTLISWHG